MKKQLPTGCGKIAFQEGSCTDSFLAATCFFKTGCRPKGDQAKSSEKETSDRIGAKLLPKRGPAPAASLQAPVFSKPVVSTKASKQKELKTARLFIQ